MTAAVDARRAGAVLERLLVRLARGKPIGSDLILVADEPALDDVPAAIEADGLSWAVRRVRGELELRDALPDGGGDGRLIAVVPPRLDLPVDLRDRSFLHRRLDVRVEDILWALTGRACPTLGDEALEQAVRPLIPDLAARLKSFTLGLTLTPRDVRSMVVATLLDSEGRVEREEPGKLLARWLVTPPQKPEVLPLLGQVLEEAFGVTGILLSRGLTTGRLADLVVAGALAGAKEGWEAARSIPNFGELLESVEGFGERTVRETLRGLAAGAARVLTETDSAVLKRILAPAEAVAHQHQLHGHDYPLLVAALDLELEKLAGLARDGKPAEDGEVSLLSANLHAREQEDSIAFVRWAGRLARFVTATPAMPDTLADWAGLALTHVGWADRAVRELRRRSPRVAGSLRTAGEAVLAQALVRREKLNTAFADLLSRRFEEEVHARNVARPFALDRLAGLLVGPLVRRGEKVFLAILDGCDVSVFLELCESLPDEIGLALPPGRGDALTQGLEEGRAFRPAFSLPPTVTSRARRALFAGEVPGNPVLDDTEAAAADASGDRKAFEKCAALGTVSRRLFLKSDLADGGTTLVRELGKPRHDLVAAVFNDVDDALSSKETTPLPAKRAADLGEGFRDAVVAAVAHGWTVIVTSDHGHTPFLGVDRKQPGSADGQRFRKGDAPVDGEVLLSAKAVPGGPFCCLHRPGAYFGAQRRGFHGGVGLEEMVVPLGFLGRVAPGLGRPLPPAWWSSAGGVEVPQPAGLREEVTVMSSGPLAATAVPEEYARLFAPDSKEVAALTALARHGRLSRAQLATKARVKPERLLGFLNKLLLTLRRAELAEPFVIEGSAESETYLWTRAGGEAK